MKKNSDKEEKHKSKNNSHKAYILVGIFVFVIAILMLYKMNNKEEKYLVNEGKIEYTTSGIGYIIKNETIIDVDTSKVLVPTVSEGSRISKNNIIATYRGTEYQDYQNKLKEIDAEILLAMKDINLEYSIDISNLESQVVNAVVNSQGVSSIVDMQECKTNVDSLLSKRASIIGELSPEEAYVKELIARREKIESELMSSSANVKAPIGGIISYMVDSLEDKLTVETIMNLNYEDVKNCVKNREEISSSKIRITSNYEAYVLVRADNIDSEYIKRGEDYELRIMGAEMAALKGTITKITETEQGYEVLFRVTNGIENIVDSRECEIEVVWTSYEGLTIPLKAITRAEDGKDYVKIITRGEYVDIPIKIKQKNKTYAIVENYEKENVNSYVLERYDQVIFSEK